MAVLECHGLPEAIAAASRDAIRGYIDTTRKHGRPVMAVIHDALTGNP